MTTLAKFSAGLKAFDELADRFKEFTTVFGAAATKAGAVFSTISRDSAQLNALGVSFDVGFQVFQVGTGAARGLLQVSLPATAYAPRVVLVALIFDAFGNVRTGMSQQDRTVALGQPGNADFVLGSLTDAYFTHVAASAPP